MHDSALVFNFLSYFSKLSPIFILILINAKLQYEENLASGEKSEA